MILKPYNIELLRDYDGITHVEFITERPYTYEKVSKAIKYITRGLRIYLLIKKVQESEAIKIIINLINTFLLMNSSSKYSLFSSPFTSSMNLISIFF